MGGKHKKDLRSEKSKVKLKGAKLPKGLNVTKTDFKVKKILIKAQLQETYLEDGSKKQTIKENISRLKHHNLSIRLQAIKNIKEILLRCREEILQNLGPLIQAVTSICIDIEKEARRESFRLLTAIFQLIQSSDIVRPFFGIISSYLRCAMTHIQPSIQEDSLLLLDTLLLNLPELVAANNHKIFANFLDIISKIRHDSNTGRTLTTNLGNKVTSVKWRNKILERLCEMLSILNRYRKDVMHSQNVEPKVFLIDEEHFYPIRMCNISEERKSSISALFSISKESDTKADLSSDLIPIENYVQQLVPLLLESWMEVRPGIASEHNKNNPSLLDEDAAYTLKVILKIFKELYHLVEHVDRVKKSTDLQKWIRTEFGDVLITYMSKGYPFQRSEIKASGKKQQKKTKPTTVAEKYCLEENILLAYLFCMFNRSIERYFREEMISVLKFFIVSFKNAVANQQLPLVEILKAILFTHGSEFMKLDSKSTRILLEMTLATYLEHDFPSNQRTKVLTFLNDIILDDKLIEIYGREKFNPLLTALPKMLCQPAVSNLFIRRLSELGKRSNKDFLAALKDHHQEIIENLPNIRVTGAINEDEGRISIVNLFYWINDWSQLDKNVIVEKIVTFGLSDSVCNHLGFVLNQSFNKNTDSYAMDDELDD